MLRIKKHHNYYLYKPFGWKAWRLLQGPAYTAD